MATKKLIEVALPLERINAESAREKSIRHGHPSTLHLWWARRPLAAARAVIWASLVDDPSSHPELFPSEEDQNTERQRLFHILEDLVVWENSNNKAVLNRAKAEIMKSTDNNPPTLLDPFAGGGAIPLEGQRLGLEAHAHDLNPVAVMINKAMIEIPPKFTNWAPVNPDDRISRTFNSWQGSQGLAADIKYYSEWMKKEAIKRIGHLYPKVSLSKTDGGGKATVLSWLWARTVKCSNPACGCTMPLASTFILSKKKGNEAWAKPIVEGNNVRFEVIRGKCPTEYETLKQGRSAVFKCPKCGEITQDKYMKEEGKAGRLGCQLMAVIAEGRRGRLYLSPDTEQEEMANLALPESYPDGYMPNNPRWFSPPMFGMEKYSEIFTPRQLTALTLFSELIAEAQTQAERDAIEAGVKNDHIPLSKGGSGALAYGQAIGVYLAFIEDRMADKYSSLCVWNRVGEKIEHTFGRQAIPMVWEFAEANPFSNSSGCFDNMAAWVYECVQSFSPEKIGLAEQHNAQTDCGMRNVLISTDPPYYDLVGFADLSDYFYVWMRNSLLHTYPNLFSTVLAPKAEELLATPYRHGGDTEKAKSAFEDGMFESCKQLYKCSSDDFPVTIYYAYKENDTSEGGQSSSGWETMLSAIIRAGFVISGTWPMRTERSGRLNANGTNALASAIILACRKRPNNAPVCTRRNFINELKRELRPALQKLQSSNIAPVDLAQSAIGPGMGVFSKYSQVLEADGTPMSVRSALQIINQELDLFFNEQDSVLDSESRFCVDLYSQFAFNEISFGDANTLATAKNTSVAIMASHRTLYAQKGKVRLIERAELPEKIDENEGSIWLLCQQLTYKMEKEGIEGCAKAIYNMFGSNAERAKDLAYRLYTIAERKKWAQEAYAYNALVVAWPEIQSRAAELKAVQPEQMSLLDFLQ